VFAKTHKRRMFENQTEEEEEEEVIFKRDNKEY
jgi:hypothetical protein